MWAMIPQSPTRFPSSTHSCFRVTWASCVEDGRHLSPPLLVLALHPAGGSARPPGFPGTGGFVLCGPRLCALFSGASAMWVPLCWEPRSIPGGRTRLWLSLYSKRSTRASPCLLMNVDLSRPSCDLFKLKGMGSCGPHFPLCLGQIITG